ncbi:periplasmic component of amino acid ABC-type transporter/signal transduction system [Herbaspirillum sp. CF444]|uniref:transporter substrate-binding domain-containing protein n=1 Tax=Herbaspirillum sp. CF444 TaxID=1144319 RepID=UPI0002727336|nr:transporter substrate-binding domain-containing protein [Herbaspirillum sp. CF444]EJL93810.1 periplasmic component of amino acid ABC-type transporter/signal transduction system [Herbaspirillum sp. CF444]
MTKKTTSRTVVTSFLPSFHAVARAAAVFAATGVLAGTAHADATLDKIRQRHKIVVGVMLSGGPFGSIDPSNQKPLGWNVELAQDIARKLGVELETVQVQPSNRVQLLQQGKVDILIAGMEWTPERNEILSFAPTPFYKVGGVAIVPKDSGIQRWEDLRGKEVCLSQGSNYAKPLTADYGATVKGFKSSAESLLALRGSNCVAAVHDATLLYPLANSNPEWKNYRTLAPELIPGNSVVWARKGEQDTVAAIDKIIQGWHKSGWLITTEKKLNITPASSALVELHDKFKKS